MSAKEQWVRVESEDELRPGMVTKALECEWCNRDDVMVIVKRVASAGRVRLPSGRFSKPKSEHEFVVSGSCDDSVPWELLLDINAGMLFRLAIPPDEAALADEKEAKRSAEKVKERTR